MSDQITPKLADRIARALHAAGLLADPADRDEQHVDLTPVAEIIRNAQAYRDDTGIVFKPESAASDLFSAGWLAGRSERLARERAEAERDHAQEVAELAEKDRQTYHRDAIRAEAEVAELREKVEELRLIANVNGDWNVKYDQLKQRADAAEAALAEANEWGDRYKATVDRVRALADEWDRTLQDTLLVEINELRAALDAAGGEQHGE